MLMDSLAYLRDTRYSLTYQRVQQAKIITTIKCKWQWRDDDEDDDDDDDGVATMMFPALLLLVAVALADVAAVNVAGVACNAVIAWLCFA